MPLSGPGPPDSDLIPTDDDVRGPNGPRCWRTADSRGAALVRRIARMVVTTRYSSIDQSLQVGRGRRVAMCVCEKGEIDAAVDVHFQFSGLQGP